MGNDDSLFIFAWSFLCGSRVDREVSDLYFQSTNSPKGPTLSDIVVQTERISKSDLLSIIHQQVRNGFHQAEPILGAHSGGPFHKVYLRHSLFVKRVEKRCQVFGKGLQNVWQSRQNSFG